MPTSTPQDSDAAPPLPTVELATRHRTRARSASANETLELMRAVTRAWQEGELDRLRELLHPEGSWTFTCEGDEIFDDRDALVDAIRRAQSETVYRMDDVTHVPLSDSVVLGAAFIRRPLARGHAVDRHYWLCETRDGLFYRSVAFRREQDAFAAYAAGWAEDSTAGSAS